MSTLYVQVNETGLLHLPKDGEYRTKCDLAYDLTTVTTIISDRLSRQQQRNTCPYCTGANPCIMAARRAAAKKRGKAHAL